MTKGKVIENLTELKKTVEEFNTIKYESTDKQKELHKKISELYGSVQEYYLDVTGEKNIEVPVAGSQLKSNFNNYFEAGYLSGRTFHSHQGYLELISVLAKIESKKSLNDNKSIKNSWTRNEIIGVLAIALTILGGTFSLGKYLGENKFDQIMINLNDENKSLKIETLQLIGKLKSAKDSINNLKSELNLLEDKIIQNQLIKK